MNPLEIIEKYYAPQTELYRILVQHSCDVADYASALGALCQEPIDLNFVRQAAMLHDIGIFLCSAPTIACTGKEPYILHGRLGADLLRTEGLPLHAFVAERHTGVGLYPDEIRVRKLPLPINEVFYPLSIEEQIICYADKFFSKTTPGIRKPFNEVRKKIAAFGAANITRFDLLARRFDPDSTPPEDPGARNADERQDKNKPLLQPELSQY